MFLLDDFQFVPEVFHLKGIGEKKEKGKQEVKEFAIGFPF